MKSAKETGGNQQERLEPSWGELVCALAFQQGWAERKLLTASRFYDSKQHCISIPKILPMVTFHCT